MMVWKPFIVNKMWPSKVISFMITCCINVFIWSYILFQDITSNKTLNALEDLGLKDYYIWYLVYQATIIGINSVTLTQNV